MLVRHDAAPTQAPIQLYQTAAGAPYEAMLTATEPLHSAYCAANRIDYVVERGVRRGHHPWQASFNRIEQLADLLACSFDGWFAYLDADAVIRQPGFDLRRFLGKRAGAALIAAPGGSEWWNVNNGIFFLNLGNPGGRDIAAAWHGAAHATVSDRMLREAIEPWQPLPDGRPFPDDQHLLQMELMRRPALEAVLLRDDSGLLHPADGRFICQFMRTSGAAAERLAGLRAAVAAASS